MIVCKACGTSNSPGVAYCSKCARKLDDATQQAVVAKREAHTATGIRWTAVVAAAVLVILIALLVALLVTGVI